MTRLGAAVIGLGVGREHVRAYALLPASELVAICDVNPERLRAVADEYGATTYSDVADLLRDDRVEVVSVATPHPQIDRSDAGSLPIEPNRAGGAVATGAVKDGC